jgi:hypothetical protein
MLPFRINNLRIASNLTRFFNFFIFSNFQQSNFTTPLFL